MWNPQDWQAVEDHARRCQARPIREIVASEAGREKAFSRRLGPLYFNFARQHIDAEAMADLQQRLVGRIALDLVLHHALERRDLHRIVVPRDLA